MEERVVGVAHSDPLAVKGERVGVAECRRGGVGLEDGW